MIGTNFGIYRPSSGTANTSANTNEERSSTYLSDFMVQLEDYIPTLPDSVTAHYLNAGGFETNDIRLVRLVSVATQKFISDVVNDALQHCKARTHNHLAAQQAGFKPKERKYTLTMDDLTPALADYGIVARKADYFQ